MSNSLVPQAKDFSSAEVKLIRDTIAPNATEKEFELFIYRCKNMGLDPLKPGQIFFIKYGTGPGTIVVGREGFRVRASKTGKHTGTKVGTIRGEKNEVIGAWCEVYRSDWQHPARAEVFLSEYNTGKSQWAKMPITMIQKVAEAAALRMAFPDELGGLYLREEMDQAEPEMRTVTHADKVDEMIEHAKADVFERKNVVRKNPGDHRIMFGARYSGKTIAEAVERDGHPEFQKWLEVLRSISKKNGYATLPPDHGLVAKLYEDYCRELKANAREEAPLTEEEELLVERMASDLKGGYQYTPEDALRDRSKK